MVTLFILYTTLMHYSCVSLSSSFKEFSIFSWETKVQVYMYMYCHTMLVHVHVAPLSARRSLVSISALHMTRYPLCGIRPHTFFIHCVVCTLVCAWYPCGNNRTTKKSNIDIAIVKYNHDNRICTCTCTCIYRYTCILLLSLNVHIMYIVCIHCTCMYVLIYTFFCTIAQPYQYMYFIAQP